MIKRLLPVFSLLLTLSGCAYTLPQGNYDVPKSVENEEVETTPDDPQEIAEPGLKEYLEDGSISSVRMKL